VLVSAAWLGEALSFDLETTGVNPLADRIVTACAVEVGPRGAFMAGRWLLNPGIDIPEGATNVHGITTEKVQADGIPALDGVTHIADTLRRAWRNGQPVIVMNAGFDLTLLAAELERYAQEPLSVGPVLDPLVIDRACDPYRKGKRTLSALAAHYGVEQGAAHTSDGDAITAARIVWRQARKYPDLMTFTLAQMQDFQRASHATWAGQFELWLRQQGKPEVIDREWPVRRVA
jgi:DNA polymerase-3 subunit epsilon